MSAHVSHQFPQKFGRLANFRISTPEHYEEWTRFKENCSREGLNICHVVVSLISAWNRSVEGVAKVQRIVMANGIVNLQMSNQFVYAPQRPRREPPPPLIRSKQAFARTISNKASELYILWKTSDLHRSFSYLDLSELPQNYARKEILRLKNKGLVKPIAPRTRPRFYVPTVRLRLEPVDRIRSKIIE